MYSPRQKVLWFAFSSRLFIIVLQAFSNLLITDHDANVFISPVDPRLRKTNVDFVVDKLFSGFKRWDAQYFLHIAQFGYTHENCLAFFPLFPMLVRYTAYALDMFLYSVMNFHSILLVTATLLNMIMFIKSVELIYEISLHILKCEGEAYKSAILYCVNPASIFFSAPYSETLFSLLTFHAILFCLRSNNVYFGKLYILSAMPTGLSWATRSNGFVNIGFLIYTVLKNIAEGLLHEIKQKACNLNYDKNMAQLLRPIIACCSLLILSTLIAMIPFGAVQLFHYYNFCTKYAHNVPYFVIKPGLVLPGKAESPWCNYALPLSYSYIQSNYWNVGFLKYYEIKQLPNFLLATPVVVLTFYYCFIYIRHNFQICIRLGIGAENTYSVKTVSRLLNKTLFESERPELFVYVIHILSLAIVCVLFVHIQVSTRILASCSPMLYWICSSQINFYKKISSHKNKRKESQYLSIIEIEGEQNMCSRWRTFIISRRMPDLKAQLIQYYFIGYLLVGTVLFSNNYPWT